MRVLIMIDPDRNPTTTGASWVGVLLANLLNARGINVGVVTRLNDYSMFDEGVTIHEPDELDSRAINKSIVGFAVDMYKKYNYDILNVHSGNHTVIKWLSYVNDINLVVTIHNSFMGGRSSVVYGPFAHSMMSNPRVIVVSVSKYAEKLWEDFSDTYSSSQSVVIYNGINEYSMNPINYSDRTYDIVMCSRIDPGKMTLETIESMRRSGLRSLFIGDTYERNQGSSSEDYYRECKELIETSSNIEWNRKLTNFEAIKKFSDSRLLLDLSKSEACPMVVLESLYAGCKVIYPNYCEGIREVLSYKDSDLVSCELEFVPRSRWTRRYDLIKDVISSELVKGYDPEVLHKYYNDNFSSSRMVDLYIATYDRLLGVNK